jgi:sacsin
LPVHIHGLFSISPDRSRLHGLDDKGVQDDRPESWNRFLFGQMIPSAWAKLLVNVCRTRQNQDLFHLWPTKSSGAHQWWYGLSRAVIDKISGNNDPVWFTGLGYVPLKDGLLASEATNIQQKAAFQEAGLRVIYLTGHLLEEAHETPGSRTLRPRTLYEGIREVNIVEHLSSQTKLVLLEYLQHEIPLKDLAALEIFPFKDGTLRPLTLPPNFLHRDIFEKKLFTRQSESTIDTERVSEATSRWLHTITQEDDTLVRYRTPADLCDYFLNHVANGSSDVITYGEEERSIVIEVLQWIMRHCQGNSPPQALGQLWLVPLRNHAFRKLIPLDVSNSATWFDSGNGKELAMRIAAVDPSNAPKIIADEALSDEAVRCLRLFAEKEPSLRLEDGNKLEGFLNFLKKGQILLQNAAEDVKDSVFPVVKEMYWARKGDHLNVDTGILKTLCIFKEIQWPFDATGSSTIIRSSTDLTRNVVFVGMKKLVPLPLSSNHVFLDATDECARSLFEDLHLVRCFDEVQILEELVIPALQDGGYEHMNSNFRLDVTELLFQNYFRLSPSAQGRVPSLSVVPLEEREEKKGLSFGCPVDIMDPHQSALGSLYFEDERMRPESHFYHRFSGVLASCGMIKKLDERLVLDRISVYERKQLPFDVVASRAEKLLQLPICEDSSRPNKFTQSVRSCMWLPAQTRERSRSLTDAVECRDSDDQPLVGHVWLTLPFRVEREWRSILGWQDRIQVDVLMSQLDRSIDASDVHSVEQTLVYLDRHYKFEDYGERLSGLNFIRSSNGLFVSPAQACREGGERLMPYLHNVDLRFWDEHMGILTQVNIPRIPDLGRLHDVQNALESKGALKGADLDVAVEIARIWGSQSSKSFDNLKVPDDAGMLVDVDSLVFNDAPWISEVNRAIAHPNLSRADADRLKMQPLSNLLRNGDLGISDFDEDEFDQREEVADGIKDTLDRYTRESTFHEFLANADDCGSASMVNFLFDGTTYNTERLLTTELNSVQGPALLVHNDGGKQTFITLK